MSSLAIPKRKKPVALTHSSAAPKTEHAAGISRAPAGIAPPSRPAAQPVKKEEPELESSAARPKWTSYTLRAGGGAAQEERYNVMRFSSNRSVDPGKDLARPVKLARRNPQEPALELLDPQAQVEEAAEPQDQAPAPSVAPYGGPARKKGIQRKTRQIYAVNAASSQLRAEERFPWVMQDFDGKTFEGTLEGGQGGTYVFLQYSPDGFTVTPISKFFKFQQRAQYQKLSIDEAEEKMGKARALPRWFMKDRVDDGSAQAAERQYRIRTTDGPRSQNVKKEEMEEELDFNEDFADDEEQHALVENEEDNKELEDRIKKEMLSANALGDATAGEESEDEDTKRALDREGRRLQRYLEKLEKNNMYKDDSDSDPYKSTSDSETEQGSKKTPSAPGSAKGDDDKSADRKRDESIRDQVNKLQNTSVTTYNTPQPGGSPLDLAHSRTASTSSLRGRLRTNVLTLHVPRHILERFPGIPPSQVDAAKKRRNGSVDSDRSQKKIRFGRHISPEASRAGSPSASAPASRPGSPSRRTSSRASTPASEQDLITAEELRTLILAKSLTMRNLLKVLKPRLASKTNKDNLGKLLRQIGASAPNGVLVIKQ